MGDPQMASLQTLTRPVLKGRFVTVIAAMLPLSPVVPETLLWLYRSVTAGKTTDVSLYLNCSITIRSHLLILKTQKKQPSSNNTITYIL